MRASRESIIKDIHNLGIDQGDTVYVASDLMKVGYFKKNRDYTLQAWVDILLEVIGPQGTIIAAAYTDRFLRFKKNKDIVFTSLAPPNSGSLSTALFQDKRSIRSTHPTNSFVGIGPNAAEILKGHDHESLSYSPPGKMVDLGCKELMLGSVDEKSGSVTLHYAQQRLGYSSTHPFSGMYQTYFKDEQGKTQLFTRYDVGGCTRGSRNLFGTLIVNDAVKFGFVGRGRSAVFNMKKAFEITLEMIGKNRKITHCDDPKCISCHGLKLKYPFNIPFATLSLATRKLRNR